MGEVERLKRLLASATPGEWHAMVSTLRAQFPTPIACVVDGEGKEIIGWSGFDSAQAKGATSQRRRAANAKFTAAAHNALPALLSQLEEMREREQKLVEALTAFVQQMEDALSSSVLPDGSVFVAGQTDVELRADGGLTLNQVKALLSQTDEVKSDG